MQAHWVPANTDSTHRVGAAVTLVDAMVSGIFAGDIRRLSVSSCFPIFKTLEQEHGGIIRGQIARRWVRVVAVVRAPSSD